MKAAEEKTRDLEAEHQEAVNAMQAEIDQKDEEIRKLKESSGQLLSNIEDHFWSRRRAPTYDFILYQRKIGRRSNLDMG